MQLCKSLIFLPLLLHLPSADRGPRLYTRPPSYLPLVSYPSYRCEYADIITLLMKNKADASIKDVDGKTPRDVADENIDRSLFDLV